MKKEDVPQQADDIYEGVKKVIYAVNKEGDLVLEQSAGWAPEIEVLKQAVDEVNRLAYQALQRVHAGISSPLDYHMHAQRMDLPMLAQSAGYYKWTVKKHCKPVHFARLSDAKLQNYAQTLGISVETLTIVPDLS